MLTMQRQNGFTLVELAASMIIIGLLAAGTLTGIKLLRNAKVAATAMQIQNYSAAVRTFEKTYKGLPGDLPNAHKKIRGCQAGTGFAGCELVPGGGAVTSDVPKPSCDPNCATQLAAFCASKTASAAQIGVCETSVGFYNSYGCGGASPPPFCAAFYPSVEVCLAAGGLIYTDISVCNAAEKYDYYDSVTTQVAVTGMMGDGAVGAVSWDMVTFRGDSADAIDGANAVDFETVLFWYQLKQVNLIGGVTDAGLRSGSKPRFGQTHPAAEAGGGFWIGYSDGTYGGASSSEANPLTGRAQGAGDYDLYGNILVLVRVPTGDTKTTTYTDLTTGLVISNKYAISTAIDSNVFTPEDAQHIDLKLDDGQPHTGIVQAFGTTNSCYGSAPFKYDTREGNRDCGLYIRIK